MTAHSWEVLQHERAREAALATVHRLDLALVELEVELDFRREELGRIIADRHDRGARLFAANQAGARMVFGGSDQPSTAERGWDDAPASAVQAVATHIAEAPRLAAEETAALGAVSDLERRALQTTRALAHWRAVAGNGSPPPSDSPDDGAPSGPTPEPEAEEAKAATTQWTAPEPSAAQLPASGSGSLRGRLAVLADRVAGW